MASVKAIMNCIGAGTSGSVLGQLFGFFRARIPADPCSAATPRVSLLDLVQSLQSRHFHLNIIRVGVDNFTDDEIDKIDYAIFRARPIYRAVSLGIGRIQHFDVDSSEAGGKNDLGSVDEAEDLTHDWTVPNDGLDVFLVENVSSSDFVGISAVDGSCDKDSKGFNGVIAGEVNRDAEAVARTFSHEIGHYLGLSHNHGDDCPTTDAGTANLMAQTRCASSTCNSVVLTSSQGNTMRSHCSVKSGC